VKLSFEFIPRWSAGNNLRTTIGEYKWRRFRRYVLEDCENRCAICGWSGGRLECHEVLAYDDDTHVMTLVDVVCLCHLCHAVTHLNLSTSGRSSYRVGRSTLAMHFCAVNGCSMEDFESALSSALSVWNERSTFNWTVELGKFQCLTWKFPRDAFQCWERYEFSEAYERLIAALAVFDARHPEYAPMYGDPPDDWDGVVEELGYVDRLLYERRLLREALPAWELFNRETDSRFYVPLSMFANYWDDYHTEMSEDEDYEVECTYDEHGWPIDVDYVE